MLLRELVPDGEVALLDQAGRQTTRHGVQGRAGADDATADDEDVELAVPATVVPASASKAVSRASGLRALACVMSPSCRSSAGYPVPHPWEELQHLFGRTYAGIGLVTCLTLAVAAVGTPWLRWSRRAARPVTRPVDLAGRFRDRRERAP